MLRAPSLLLKASLLFVAFITAGSACAATTGGASDAGRRSTNSFNLYVAPPPGMSNVQLTAQGVGIASSKPVISDPYKVPLIQNAGSLTPGR